jgi:pyruvate/2-oxoglutarate dehydrogenase complex dihydrolipoamide dehydrogenase (E3) component
VAKNLIQADDDGPIVVNATYSDGATFRDAFDTVIFAIGRDAETSKLGLDKVRHDL